MLAWDPAWALGAEANRRHCVTGIQRISADSPATKVVYTHCSTTIANALALAPAQEWLLATFYQNTNYDPNGASDSVSGTQGPCDPSGYDLTLTIENSIVGGISSYQYFSNCSAQSGYYWANKTSPCFFYHYGDNPYIGAMCNDHLWSAQFMQYVA